MVKAPKSFFFIEVMSLFYVSFIRHFLKKQSFTFSFQYPYSSALSPPPPAPPPPPLLWFQHANLVSAPQHDSLALSPILAAILLPPLWDLKINIPGPNKIITDTN